MPMDMLAEYPHVTINNLKFVLEVLLAY